MTEPEVIFSYTTDQAIEDGVLYHPYPQKWPNLLVTVGVHHACNTQKGRTYDQCLTPLLNYCIMEIKRLQVAKKLEFPVILENTVADTVWIMPNDKGGLTVMQPSEY
jgi:hypothetical protein